MNALAYHHQVALPRQAGVTFESKENEKGCDESNYDGLVVCADNGGPCVLIVHGALTVVPFSTTVIPRTLIF